VILFKSGRPRWPRSWPRSALASDSTSTWNSTTVRPCSATPAGGLEGIVSKWKDSTYRSGRWFGLVCPEPGEPDRVGSPPARTIHPIRGGWFGLVRPRTRRTPPNQANQIGLVRPRTSEVRAAYGALLGPSVPWPVVPQRLCREDSSDAARRRPHRWCRRPSCVT
jgi:hypothetical protein